ncbi:hypothetical protein [Virgisporangium ochraceum]|uniref:hypothetical protein n=1 Tax=Virgisporangium ochraceum TaxID=65505 RepID=UPI001944397C|nr:hypothetical protein [Virgisporangium ochraceum]
MAWALLAAAGGGLTIGDVSVFVAAAAGIQVGLAALAGEGAELHNALLMLRHYFDVVRSAPDLPVAEQPAELGPLREGLVLRDVVPVRRRPSVGAARGRPGGAGGKVGRWSVSTVRASRRTTPPAKDRCIRTLAAVTSVGGRAGIGRCCFAYGQRVSSRFEQRVIDEFIAWADGQGLIPAGKAGRDRISILLQGRADYLDRPDPTRWRSGDVHDLLMTYVVPRQVDLWDLAGHGVDTVREYLRFLDATGRLHPASTRVPTLLKELDRLAPKYPAAMADTSRWRLAKRVFTAAAADGIRIDADPEVLDAWARRFSARDADGRREVLGELIDQHPEYAAGTVLINDGQVAVLRAGTPAVKHLAWPDRACDCGCDQQAVFPPVTLPDPAVLAKHVTSDGSGLLRQLATLAAWTGDGGRPVDDRGEVRKGDRAGLLAALGLADQPAVSTDAPTVTRLWRLSIDFDVIQIRRTRIVRGDGAALVDAVLAGRAETEQTLDLWTDLAHALVHPSAPASTQKGAERLHAWLQPWTPRFLGLLYTANAAAEPVDVEALWDLLLDEYAQRLPPGDPDLFAGMAAVSVRQTLAELDRHGAVVVTGDRSDPDPRHVATAAVLGGAAWAVHPEPGLMVGLTDLGRHLVRQRLLAENADAPLTA